MEKKRLLVAYLTNECQLDVHISDVDESRWGEGEFSTAHGDYLVLDDDEADIVVRSRILDLVWAFMPEFLVPHLIDGINEDVVKILQEKCESANEPLTAMIKDVDHFIDDAVKSDGRGHFLSGYDGNESEYTFKGETVYIYRTN